MKDPWAVCYDCIHIDHSKAACLGCLDAAINERAAKAREEGRRAGLQSGLAYAATICDQYSEYQGAARLIREYKASVRKKLQEDKETTNV